MNKMIVVLNLIRLVFTTDIQISKPTAIDEAKYKINDQTLRIPDEVDILPILSRKDDVISTSDLNNVYTIDNKYAKTQFLKDETENVSHKNAGLKHGIFVANSKSTKKIVKPEQRSGLTTESIEIETKEENNENIKSSEKKSAKSETKSENVEPIEKSGVSSIEDEDSKSSKTELDNNSDSNAHSKYLKNNKEAIQIEGRNSVSSIEVDGSESPKTELDRNSDSNSLINTKYMKNNKEAIKTEGKNSVSSLEVDDSKSPKTKIDRSSDGNTQINKKYMKNNKDVIKIESESKINDGIDVKARVGNKEETKTVDDGKTEIEKVTSTRSETKEVDYLYNDNDESQSKYGIDKDSEIIEHEMPVEDESKFSWDLLDDLPAARRMFSQAKPTKIDMKIKTEANESVGQAEIRTAPEAKQTSRNNVPHGSPAGSISRIPQFQSSVLIPHIHPAGRRFIVPGFINVRPPVTQDLQRQMNPLEKNKQHERPVERAKSTHAVHDNRNAIVANEQTEARRVIDYMNTKDNINSYPYTPKINLQQPSNVNPIVAKLIDASEHPQNFSPNRHREISQTFPNMQKNSYTIPNTNPNYYANNLGIIQNTPGIPYNYVGPINYPVPQNYGVYKYVTGFGRSS